MRDMLEARKRGDFAFRDRDFKTAATCYSQVSQFRRVLLVWFFCIISLDLYKESKLQW